MKRYTIWATYWGFMAGVSDAMPLFSLACQEPASWQEWAALKSAARHVAERAEPPYFYHDGAERPYVLFSIEVRSAAGKFLC